MRFRPVLLAILLLICGSAMLEAQVKKSDLESRWNKKQAEPFLKHVNWERSLKSAKERASRSNRPIVAYFTRSYAP